MERPLRIGVAVPSLIDQMILALVRPAFDFLDLRDCAVGVRLIPLGPISLRMPLASDKG